MAAFLFLFGVLLGLWMPQGVAAIVAVLAVTAAFFVLQRFRWAGLGLALGYGYALIAVYFAVAPALPLHERLLVNADIQSLPTVTDRGWQFEAMLQFPQLPDAKPVMGRVSVPALSVQPQVGERWRLVLQLTQQLTADGELRTRNALLRDHLTVVAQGQASPLNYRVAGVENGWGLQQLRAKVARKIETYVVDPAASALLKALAVGATGDVTVAQWQIFNATGITHLIAISGLHVTFFALLAMKFARWLWCRLALLQQRCKRESFAALVGVCLALGYALLSGFSVPAQRTVAMLAAFLAARCLGRMVSKSWSVVIALLAVLLFDPFAALSAGFWLSFAAVAAIIFFAGAPLLELQHLRAAVRVQTVVTIVLVPVTVAIFGTFATLGPLVNAVAIPLFTFLLVPLVLIATLACLVPGAAMEWITAQLLKLAESLAGGVWPPLQSIADADIALLYAQAEVLWFPVAAIAAIVLMLPITGAQRAACAFLLASPFIGSGARLEVGAASVQVIDVGASAAVIIGTRSHQLLWGLGEVYGSDGKRTQSRVLPQLRRGSSSQLDMLVVGKPTRDVLAAVSQIAAVAPATRIVVDRPHDRGPELTICNNHRWSWDSVQFELHRTEPSGQCWLEVRTAAARIVVAPDLESLAPLTGAAPARIKAELIVLPRSPQVSAAALNVSRSSEAWLVASVSEREWQSRNWRGLREQAATRGLSIIATATQGTRYWLASATGRISERGKPW
jgi:competence protein ComEC